MRYDHAQLCYVYICTACKVCWRHCGGKIEVIRGMTGATAAAEKEAAQ